MRSGGDARTALNALELAVTTAQRAQEPRVTLGDAEDALQRKAVLYDKAGDQHYDYISAWIKSTRGSDPDASLYYLAAMVEGGEDPRFIARRMIVLASEDIGNADPQALPIAVAAAARGRARRPAGGGVRARAGGDLPVAGAEVRRGQARARRGPRPHPRARRQAAARRAALGGLPGGAQARPRQGLRLPARAPGPRQRPGAPARGARGRCASTSRTRASRSARAARARSARRAGGESRPCGQRPPAPCAVTSLTQALPARPMAYLRRRCRLPSPAPTRCPAARRCGCAWPRRGDAGAVAELLAGRGIEASDVDLARLLAFDPARRAVICACAPVDGRETVVGIGAIDLRRGRGPRHARGRRGRTDGARPSCSARRCGAARRGTPRAWRSSAQAPPGGWRRSPQPLWSLVPAAGRARYLRRAATAILDELDPLADALADAVGQPRTEAVLAELLPSVGGLHDLADDGPKALRDRRLGRIAGAAGRAPRRRARRRRSAWSACAAGRASPWAEPVLETGAALLAGNAVVLSTPLEASGIRAAFERGGVPAELIALAEPEEDLGARCRPRRRHAPAAAQGHDARARRRAARARRRPARCGRRSRAAAATARRSAGSWRVPSVAEPLLRRARGRRRAAAPRRPAPARHRDRPAALAARRARGSRSSSPRRSRRAPTLLCGGPLDVRGRRRRVLRARGAARRPAGRADPARAGARAGARGRRGGDGGRGDRARQARARRSRCGPRDRARGERVARELEAEVAWVNEHGHSIPDAAVRLAGHVESRRIASQPTRLRSARWLPYDPQLVRAATASARLHARPRERAPRRAARPARCRCARHRGAARARGASAADEPSQASDRRGEALPRARQRAQPRGQQRHDHALDVLRAAVQRDRRAPGPTTARSRGGSRGGSSPTVIWLTSSSSGRAVSGTGGRMTISIASSRACGVM